MRFYKITEEDKIDIAFNRCFLDANNGRVWLALMRLRDLKEIFSNDAQLLYAEALIRKDFLGQGIKAGLLFEQALELDSKHAFAACNVAKYTLTKPVQEGHNQLVMFAACNAVKYASTKEVFKDRLRKAMGIAPNDTSLLSMKYQQESMEEEPHWKFLASMEPPAEDKKYGETAALLEIILENSDAIKIEYSNNYEKIVNNSREVRAENLRSLDRDSEDYLRSVGEQFLPTDRLALEEALKELELLQSDKNNAAYHNQKIWNLRAAWTYLMHDFETAILYAEEAIKISPNGYALPYLNKALCLWELGRPEKALECAKEALRQAESAKNEADVAQVLQAMKEHEIARDNWNLSDFMPQIRQVLHGAREAAEREIKDQRGNINQIVSSLLQRTRMVGMEWDMAYVSIMAELLTFYSPEATMLIVSEASKRTPSPLDNLMNASLYLIGHSNNVMQRDAARFLTLMIIIPLNPKVIRKTYRMGILEVSAVAHGNMTILDTVMRTELLRIHPKLPALIADQETVDEQGKERGQMILSKFNTGVTSPYTPGVTLPYTPKSVNVLGILIKISIFMVLVIILANVIQKITGL